MSAKPKIPGKKSSKGDTSNSIAAQLTNPTVLAGVVGAIVLLGALLAFIDSEPAPTPELRDFENFLKRNGVRRKKVEIVCNATSRTTEQGCYLAARAPMYRGEPALKIPKELIIDVRSILEMPEYREVLGREENSTLDTFIKENNLEQSYYYYIYAYFLAAEKHKGKSSNYAEWIAILPTDSQLNTGLQWDPADDECLDESTRQELQYFRSVLSGIDKIQEVACTHDRCVRLSEDDQRWGMSIYRSRSFQEQAIVIPLDFGNHDQNIQTLIPEWNQEEKVLDIKLTTNVNKGDELYVHYGPTKTPMALLISHGFVEDAVTSFFPASVQMDVEKIPLLKRYGCDKRYEIGYAASGRPRSTFLNCIYVLVATEEQRARWKSIYKNDTSFEWSEIVYFSYGNLTYGIEVTAQKSRPVTDAKCTQRTTAALTMVSRMQQSTMQFLVKAHKYCGEMRLRAQHKYIKMGGVVPTENEQQQSGQGSDASGSESPDPSVSEPDTAEP